MKTSRPGCSPERLLRPEGREEYSTREGSVGDDNPVRGAKCRMSDIDSYVAREGSCR